MRYVNLSALLTIMYLLITAGCGGGGGGSRASLTSITVTPAGSTLAVGNTRAFTATGTYSNNSTKDITTQVTWSASLGGTAMVSNTAGSKGVVTALSQGTATITATLGDIAGSATLTTTASGSSANVMKITVNGALCSANSYLNKPCVSVTICNPDLSACQTVNDILLDTGSFGLRVFQQAIPNLTLPAVGSGSGSLTGCVQFADGSSLWGPIRRGMVKLADEPYVSVPIQVINSSFGSLPFPCANADPSPISSGFNGILGVGVFKEDCGLACAFSAANGVYYSCIGTSCTGVTVPLADQVQNPVAALPTDNNGLIVRLPSVPPGGASSIDGSLILGVGTRSNNTLTSPTVLRTDSSGDVTTVIDNISTNGFFDTGSNALFFPNPDPSLLPVCPSPNTDWYCPPATRTLSATNIAATGAPSSTVTFNVSNLNALLNTSNNVFVDIGGPSDFGFDWGLPFFMGRSVAFGIESETSSLGTGPYVAY